MTRTLALPPRIGKSVSLPAATDPVSFPTGGKPPVPDELKTAPRASGGMADGKVQGNHAPLDPSLGAGSHQTQQGIDLGDPTA